MAKKTEKDRADIILEGSMATWDMKMEGDILGTYSGTFKFKCFLTPLQRIAADRERRELLGEHQTLASEHESLLAYALTQLKYRIIQSPPFWSATLQSSASEGDIPDENVILAVLNAAISSESKYMNHLKKRKKEALIKAKEAAEKLLKEQEKESDESADEESID